MLQEGHDLVWASDIFKDALPTKLSRMVYMIPEHALRPDRSEFECQLYIFLLGDLRQLLKVLLISSNKMRIILAPRPQG